ncbi:hypothetical protein FEM48_Zijuj07G0165800 [Ziziphus jujuba var. spinosa]|uniref:Bulb-type lectin domain-containing protein n=1 Tax=Ziziphus jujuba var. spinosa TaxID=714518 RepID=A0A978V5R1_ZIZJJ|nr:hypothetical protein FEM48_Zijuj07G0165800 [Ziziphus jujuba var. spinosa]
MGILSFTLLSTIFLLIFFTEISRAADIIYGTQSITGNSTLVSKDGNFEMGFFTPSGSTNRYVGIWYKDIPVKTVVWVANQQNPINDSSGTLMINSTGHLVLSRKNGVVWSTNPTKPIQAPMLQLLDSGNLVVRDENSENYLWQSFDYPCDTLLPGMKLGWDLKTGLQRRLVSWKSSDDPFPGDLTWEIDINNYPEPVMFRGSEKYYRGGPWNDLRFSGAPEIVVNQTNGYTRDCYAWNSVTQNWDVFATVPRDNCDKYALCGAYGNCIVGESPVCQCLKGFKPKGNLMDWSQGCSKTKRTVRIAVLVLLVTVVVCGVFLVSYCIRRRKCLEGLETLERMQAFRTYQSFLKRLEQPFRGKDLVAAYSSSSKLESSSTNEITNFDYLSDTLLPRMKLGWDLKIGLDRRLVSWTNLDDLLRETAYGGLKVGKYLHECHEITMILMVFVVPMESVSLENLLGTNGEREVKIVVEVLAVIFVVCGMFLLAHYICKVRARKGLEGKFEQLFKTFIYQNHVKL